MAYEWRIVSVAFLIALFSWGVAFYGTGLYLTELHRLHGWSVGELSAAISGLYFIAALLTVFTSDLLSHL